MDVQNVVESILSSHKYRSIEVNKSQDLEFDLGNLLASDPNQLDEKEFR